LYRGSNTLRGSCVNGKRPIGRTNRGTVRTVLMYAT